MLNIQTLISQTALLLSSARVGIASEITSVIQECLVNPDRPEKGNYELRAILHSSFNPYDEMATTLDIPKLVITAKELLRLAKIDVPVPISKKVQHVLCPANAAIFRQYTLYLSLTQPNCMLPFTAYHVKG